MTDDSSHQNDGIGLPFASKVILGVASSVTIVWLVAAAIFAFGYHGLIKNPDKLNEWGDFVAGVFSPIAFVWLVVAVILQSTELREQRRELTLTRKEFKHNRDVMQEQAKEAKNQADYILVQTTLLKATQEYADADRVFTTAVQHIATRLRQYVSSAWSIYRVEDRQNGDLTGTIVNIRKSSYDGEDDVLVIASTVQVLRTRLRELKLGHPNPHLMVEYAYDFQRVYRAVVTSAEKIANLPPIFHDKAATLELDELKEHMDFIADQAGIRPFEPITRASKV